MTERSGSEEIKQPERPKLLQILGSDLITGASDDDHVRHPNCDERVQAVRVPSDAAAPNQVWATDFVRDQFFDGRKLTGANQWQIRLVQTR